MYGFIEWLIDQTTECLLTTSSEDGLSLSEAAQCACGDLGRMKEYVPWAEKPDHRSLLYYSVMRRLKKEGAVVEFLPGVDLEDIQDLYEQPVFVNPMRPYLAELISDPMDPKGTEGSPARQTLTILSNGRVTFREDRYGQGSALVKGKTLQGGIGREKATAMLNLLGDYSLCYYPGNPVPACGLWTLTLKEQNGTEKSMQGSMTGIRLRDLEFGAFLRERIPLPNLWLFGEESEENPA